MDALRAQFETLYDTEVEKLFGFVALRLCDRERAKEVTNDAFMKLWQQLVAKNTIAQPRAYLYMTARNLIKNEYRSRREQNVGGDDLDELSDTLTTPAEFATTEELQRFVRALPETYRDVLTLRYFSGFAVKEIAAIMNTTETNISMRIKRGMSQLTKYYEH
jgi:RNA polymerase sigma-70 factor, ECF subfamily